MIAPLIFDGMAFAAMVGIWFIVMGLVAAALGFGMDDHD